MTTYIMRFILTAIIYILILSSCGPTKDQTHSGESNASDSIIEVENTFTADTTGITDEDPADPDLEGLIIDPSNLEPKVKTFLSSLTRNELEKVVVPNQSVLLIKPGPGIHPIYSFIKSSNDLLGVDEFLLLLSAPSILLSPTFYRIPSDHCQIFEKMPAGIYLHNIDFTDFSFFSDDEDINENLQRFTEENKSESGVEIFIKFRTQTDDLSVLHLLTVQKNGQLFLVIVDQHDCGA